MSQVDLFIILGIIYYYLNKKGIKKSVINFRVFVCFIFLAPIRLGAFFLLLYGVFPISYEEEPGSSYDFLYHQETVAMAYMQTILPLAYPIWMPYFYGVTYVRANYFPDFNKIDYKALAKNNCVERLECVRYLDEMTEENNISEYKKYYKKFYLKKSDNRCFNSGYFFNNTARIYSKDFYRVYDDIGEDLYQIYSEDQCGKAMRYYIQLLLKTKSENQAATELITYCTTNNENDCFKYLILFLSDEAGGARADYLPKCTEVLTY